MEQDLPLDKTGGAPQKPALGAHFSILVLPRLKCRQGERAREDAGNAVIGPQPYPGSSCSRFQFLKLEIPRRISDTTSTLDKAFKMSYGLSYERPVVAVGDPTC